MPITDNLARFRYFRYHGVSLESAASKAGLTAQSGGPVLLSKLPGSYWPFCWGVRTSQRVPTLGL